MLSPETIVEIIATKNGKHYKKEMTVKEWKGFLRQNGFSYTVYQKGFSQFKLEV
jgi:cobalamin biosynthesis Co2+ chelatase CbiK